jgi:hypothetical protein
MLDHVRVGRRLVPPSDLKRRVRVELHRLVVERLGVFDLSLLPQDEVDELVRRAHENVSREIAKDEAKVAEFAADDARIDSATAAAHLRAEGLLRRLGIREPSEQQYALALVASRYGTTATTDSVLEDRLEGAEALSDLAKFRLDQRGLRETDDDYEAEFLAEFSKAENEHGLDYYDAA